ncbi:MAG: PQQ-dependent sugar dehydrogenase [Polyangiaceae bacterium]|nr:PQQ-dependent sugar dehydrogenase [Polyangiaceae bacterium]
MNRPVLVRGAPGDTERLFVVEQTGKIWIVKNGVLSDKPYLDISDRVRQPNGGDERGLLGLAFHPDYQQNGRFFVFYTDKNNQGGSSGDQNIVEFKSADADNAVADANGFGVETQKLLTVFDTQGNHNGGMLDFSPIDGMLYIGLGDGGGAGDAHGPFGYAQDLSSFWGKILRIDVSTTPYSIPPGNMTAIPAGNPTQGAVKPEIWDFGLRNPWRFAFDPCNGDLYIGDVGQGAVEEVDIEAKSTGQKNYGWKYMEGTQVYSSNTPGYNEQLASFVPPVDEYTHSSGNCSISGGFIYRSSAIPALRGRYFYGDYCSGKVWSFTWNGTSIQDKIENTADLNPPGSLVSFGQDSLGNVYITSLNGTVYRLDAE